MREKTGGELWSAENLTLTIGRQRIFDAADFAVSEGERLALVGRNGSGKSTLLRIIAGLEQPASGSIAVRCGLRIAMLEQDPAPESVTGTARQVLSGGLADFRAMHRAYAELDQNSPEHRKIEHQLDLYQAWDCERLLEKMIDQLELAFADRDFAALSGGEKRRVLLGRALLSQPGLLLLDEPTNHLDIAAVEWLENFLSTYRGACLLVTHDRFFLDRIADRIVELDGGKFHYGGTCYAEFLAARAERLEAEDAQTSRRQAFLRREIDWVRRSPKARLRRNLGRLKRYEEAAAVAAPERVGDVELVIPTPSRLGNKVLTLTDVALSIGGKKLFEHFDYEFTLDAKVGLIGPNGCGKTSFLKLLTGSLAAASGKVEVADTVTFNYVDQSRLALDPEKSVLQELAGNSDHIDLGSDRIGVWSYLRRFLFEDERINTKIKYLSGGEKARLMLAKILKTGGNFLILDEPTNDLDLPTLRVLEEALRGYPSTVLVVSHDRYFLNRVCNRIIAFADGRLLSEVGDYDYFIEHRRDFRWRQESSTPVKTAPETSRPRTVSRKLSYAETRELAGMDEAILLAENKVSQLEQQFSAPDFWAKCGNQLPQLRAELAAAKAEVDRLYRRWQELEDKQSRLAE